jgi:hypothetical protein
MIEPVPFYVVVFNRIKGLQMAHDFVSRSTTPLELIVLDMGSTWEPLIKFRDSLGVQVVHFPYGMGPRDLWVTGELQKMGSGGFFLADGDIDYSEVDSDAAQIMIKQSEKYPWFPKVGLALRIDDLPLDLEGDRIRAWAKSDWDVSWENEIFLTGLDTTTAYYPRRESTFFYRPALRIAGACQAIHYPWYERPENYDDEAKFYMSLANASISSGQAGLFPNRNFKTKRIIWKLMYKALNYWLKKKMFGAMCIRILSFRGTILPSVRQQ